MVEQDEVQVAEPPQGGSGAAFATGTHRWPLIGRRHLVTRLASHSAKGRSAVIAGARGVGRTRLLSAVAQAHPGPVIAISGTDAPDPTLPARLADVAGGEPLLLAVDDAHLVDAATVLAVDRAISEMPGVAVLLTVPTGRPFPEWLVGPVDAKACVQVGLEPLAEAAMDELVRAVLGGPVEAGLLADLRRRSSGRPKTAVELLQGGREAGVVQWDGETWRSGGPLSTHRVSSDLGRLLEDVSPETRKQAAMIALGEPVPASVVGELLTPSSIGELTTLGIVDWGSDGEHRQLSFREPIDGDLLRSRIPGDRRRDLLNRLLDAFRRVEPDRFAARKALWELELGGGDAADFEAAAGSSYAAGDPELAARFGRAAVDHGAGHASRVVVAASLTELGDQDQAASWLRAADEIAADEREQAWTTVVRAHARWLLHDDAPAAREILEDVRRQTEDQDVAREVAAYTALLDTGDGWMVAARDRLAAIDHDVPGGHGDLSDRARLLGGVAAAMAWDELPGDGVLETWIPPWHQLSADVARSLPIGPSVLAAHRLDVSSELVQGAPTANRHLEVALQADRDDDQGLWLAVVGRLDLAAGAITPARSRLRDAATALERADSLRLRPLVLCLQAVAMAQAGAPSGSRRLLEEVEQDRERLPRVAAWAARADAEVIAAEDGPAAAIDHAVEAGDEAAAGGLEMSALAAWELAVRWGAGGRVVDRLDRLTGHRPTGHGHRVLRAATASVAEDGPLLREAAVELARAGRRLLAAELAVQAHGYGAQSRTLDLAAGLRTGCPGVGTPGLVTLDVVELPRRTRQLARRAMAGASSAAIADEFHLSVRTVDNQLGRAYRTLGVRGRRELARCYSTAVAPLADPHPDVDGVTPPAR